MTNLIRDALKWTTVAVALALAAGLLAGCGAMTRTMTIYPATVTISESQAVVREECRRLLGYARPYTLGCGAVFPPEPGGRPWFQGVVVRWVQTLPTLQEHEIEVHELCHVVGRLQQKDWDPCHDENQGRLTR